MSAAGAFCLSTLGVSDFTGHKESVSLKQNAAPTYYASRFTFHVSRITFPTPLLAIMHGGIYFPTVTKV
jgi:hypothetical protein